MTSSKRVGKTRTVFCAQAANRGLWHRLGLLGYYPTILRAFLPLKLCPKYVCAGDFVAGSATVATVVKLPMSRYPPPPCLATEVSPLLSRTAGGGGCFFLVNKGQDFFFPSKPPLGLIPSQ